MTQARRQHSDAPQPKGQRLPEFVERGRHCRLALAEHLKGTDTYIETIDYNVKTLAQALQ